MLLCDAHNHLHDARLDAARPAILDRLPASWRGVANGTCEADWNAVTALDAADPRRILPAFGLHPWHVEKASEHWRQTLLGHLAANPGAGIGEIGLDRWIKPPDFSRQRDAFAWQLALAAERNLPASIHCLQAWGALWEILSTQAVPARGFLLHSFGGPAEMIPGFLKRGAYFSISPYFLQPRKAAARALFAALPIERLLLETDAPDMAPPPELNAHPLTGPGGMPLNHPANLQSVYQAMAGDRQMPMESFAAQIAENFSRLFGQDDRDDRKRTGLQDLRD